MIKKNKIYLPKIFKPKKNFSLIRVGKNYDGGYLVDPNSVMKCKTLISFGINDDWSFEKKFLKINPNAKIVCYDKETSFIFLLKIFLKKFMFIFYYGIKDTLISFYKVIDYSFFLRKKLYKKNISYYDLIKITKKLKPPFFLKIDIEGSEYRILDDLIKLQKKLCGVVIEFHNIDLFLNKIKRFINLNKLQLIHIHANNVGILLNDNNIIELTFAKNPETIGKKIKFPNELDQPNLKNLPEIKLNFI